MKIVIDTNVFISAIFFSGHPDRIIRAVNKGQFEAVGSPDIVSEYHKVFYRILAKDAGKVDQSQLDDFISKLTQVNPTSEIHICRDPKDDMFLECAVEAKALYIVSGDEDLLSIKEYDGIEVVTAAEFCERYL